MREAGHSLVEVESQLQELVANCLSLNLPRMQMRAGISSTDVFDIKVLIYLHNCLSKPRKQRSAAPRKFLDLLRSENENSQYSDRFCTLLRLSFLARLSFSHVTIGSKHPKV